MSDDAGFLQAIRENRDDPGRRLVYADWLEERGDARGEFLRLSCRLAELEQHLDPAWQRDVRPSRFQSELRLKSGRVISLRAIRQSQVYEGLLEGLPTTEMNQGIINGLIEDERANGVEPYVIRPAEKPIKYHRDRPYPFGTPAAVPGIACVGRFHSFEPARGGGDYSSLVVIWFQDVFAMPIAPAVWPELLNLDWDRLANDYDY